MSLDFLPEEDRLYLSAKGLSAAGLVEESDGDAARRGVVIADYPVPAGLERQMVDGTRAAGGEVDLLLLIPTGYPVVRLDSWYVAPQLVRAGGMPINCAAGTQHLFGRSWQFWSRHLTDEEWRASDQGLESYLQYVRAELAAPQ